MARVGIADPGSSSLGVPALRCPDRNVALRIDGTRNIGLFLAVMIGIGGGVAGLVGVTVSEGTRVAGQLVRDINFPKQCMVAAVIWGREFVVPRRDTMIEVGDRVIFVGALRGGQGRPKPDPEKAVTDLYVFI